MKKIVQQFQLKKASKKAFVRISVFPRLAKSIFYRSESKKKKRNNAVYTQKKF